MTASVMMRVSPATREKVTRIANDDFGGVTTDEALRRLVDEHWERRALDAMDRFQATDPAGYADYLAELKATEGADAPPIDPWDDEA